MIKADGIAWLSHHKEMINIISMFNCKLKDLEVENQISDQENHYDYNIVICG